MNRRKFITGAAAVAPAAVVGTVGAWPDRKTIKLADLDMLYFEVGDHYFHYSAGSWWVYYNKTGEDIKMARSPFDVIDLS